MSKSLGNVYLLKDIIEKTYSPLMDYYYHLGMAYIDVEDYISAKPYLQKYLSMYQNAPIFRYDEKLVTSEYLFKAYFLRHSRCFNRNRPSFEKAGSRN